MLKILPVISFLLIFSILAEEKKDSSKVFWIDVRTTQEFKSGHVPEATHIPYNVIAKEISKLTTDKSAVIKVYCKVGGRAGIAKKTLEKLGYKNIINAGGYEQIMKERKAK